MCSLAIIGSAFLMFTPIQVDDQLPTPANGVESNESSQTIEQAEVPRRFQVSEFEDTLLMYDSATGESWILRRTPDENTPAVWVPVPKYESAEDVPPAPESATIDTSFSVPPQLLVIKERIVAIETTLMQKKIELNQALDQFGRGHPTIRRLESHIEVATEELTAENNKIKELATSQISAIETQLDEYKKTLGTEHPLCLQLSRQLDYWRAYQESIEETNSALAEEADESR